MHEEEYAKAVKLGKLNSVKEKLNGKEGHLLSLEDVINKLTGYSRIELGLKEIPLERIIGTYTKSRSEAFSSNFMPLINESKSEFKSKWTALFEHHINEGIHDPIIVVEYLNYYYVIEGNKRVSVLKYVGAYSIEAAVTRILPKFDENNQQIRLYYKFLEFNKKTKINELLFSELKNYDLMYKYLKEYNPKLYLFNDKYKHFISYVYNPFKEIYNKFKNEKISMNVSDTFIEYINLYNIPTKFDKNEENRIKNFMIESYRDISADKKVILDPIKIPKKNIITSITNFIPKGKFKVGFIYKDRIEFSGWTYAHEIARRNIQKNFGDRISTIFIENVYPGEDFNNKVSKLVDGGIDIIFTTHPAFKNDTIKAAIDYPKVKFLNCSDSSSLKHVIMYYGRMYEPRFLIGLLAGSFTKSNILGYVAPNLLRETIIDINAFTLGIQTVNPRAKVKVLLNNLNTEESTLDKVKYTFDQENADILCYHEIPAPEADSFQYGLCSMNLQEKTGENFLFSHYANIIMNWNNFYEKFLKLIIHGEGKSVFDIWNSNKDVINYWLGMDSGIIDIIYSNRYIPQKSRMLVEVFKKMIIQKQFNIFTGPIFDNEGNIKIKDKSIASYEDMRSMKWFVDGIEKIDWKI